MVWLSVVNAVYAQELTYRRLWKAEDLFASGKGEKHFFDRQEVPWAVR